MKEKLKKNGYGVTHQRKGVNFYLFATAAAVKIF